MVKRNIFKLAFFVVGLLGLATLLAGIWRTDNMGELETAVSVTPPPPESPAPAKRSSGAPLEAPVPPTAEFLERITKKPFGIFITPDNSPVSPERFTGWHNGVDVEFEDVSGSVPIRAIADGIVLRSETVSGYGGVSVVQHQLDDAPVVALYGHLDPASLVQRGATVSAGQQLGVLGESGTPATDGERKHLHFSLKPGTEVDVRGYVSTEAELADWRDPTLLFQ